MAAILAWAEDGLPAGRGSAASPGHTGGGSGTRARVAGAREGASGSRSAAVAGVLTEASAGCFTQGPESAHAAEGPSQEHPRLAGLIGSRLENCQARHTTAMAPATAISSRIHGAV